MTDDEYTALLGKADKGKTKVRWQDQEVGQGQGTDHVAVEGHRVGQGVARDQGEDQSVVDVVRLRQRVRDLEAGQDRLEQDRGGQEVWGVVSVVLLAAAVLTIGGVWAIKSPENWVGVLGVTLVLFTVSTMGPAAGILLWRAAL